MLGPFFIFKMISVLTFFRIVATGVLRMFAVGFLFVIECAVGLFLFIASIVPRPSQIAEARRTVSDIDPFEPLKQDTGLVGLIARMFF